MTRIDAHQHYWAPERGDYFWMPPDHPVLARRYTPADLEPLLAEHRIDATVLVQAAPTIEETEYMLGIADATASVAGVVGWADFEDPGHRRHLERFARHPKFVGVRPMIQDIPDEGWMLRDDVQWGFEAVAELGLVFDALGFPRHLETFNTLLRRHAAMRTVIDHCMKPQIREPGGFDAWAAGMSRLAETGAFCKLSGLVTEAGPGWQVEDLRPYAEHVLNAFGPDRVLWGSDWPVARQCAEYGAWLAAADDMTSFLDDAGAARVFGRTAIELYGLTV